MFVEEQNCLNDYNVSEVMEYLSQKLESRYNSIIKFNELINTSGTPEAFFSLRKDFKLLFNDLEEDFKQGIFAIKALTAQNKNLIEDLKIKNKENKNITEQLNNIISENKSLKLQMIKSKDKKSPEKKKENKKDINLNRKEDIKFEKKNENVIDNKNRNYEYRNNINIDEKKQKEQFNKNNYELEQLSNVKNIMDNMKKNKLKLKMAIEQHFTNNKDK